MSDGKTIRVWRFEDAPPEYQKLSTHGGDEDWVAHIPVGVMNSCYGYIGWCEPQMNGSFGCSDISQHILPNGDVVRIGAHS
jgi:hypothetical protein